MSERDKGALWAETSKPNIAGNVSKVAQGMINKIKEKYSGDLSLQITGDGNRFNYSAKITGYGRIKIINRLTLCEIGKDVLKPPYSCKKCGGCKSKEMLAELGDYLKNYNICLEVFSAI